MSASDRDIIEAIRKLVHPPVPMIPTLLGEELTPAVFDVLMERRRQDGEGYSHQQYDVYVNDELALAAATYMLPPHARLYSGDGVKMPVTWPEGWDKVHWKPRDRRRDLVRAVALGIAEIERMDRASKRTLR